MASLTHAQKSRPRGLILLVFAGIVVLALAGAAYVAYVLWPRWPAVGLDSPPLPITVGGVTFNVPPATIRTPVQRRAGTQERIDLAFVWPSLQPPAPAEKATTGADAKALGRLFVTVVANEGMAPMQRIKTIYPRYAAKVPEAGPQGLAVLPFRDDTPYQGEDLIYDADVPERFLLRCSRTKAPTPGVCLHEQRIGSADITVRFPREWLENWRDVASGIEKMLASLRPHT